MKIKKEFPTSLFFLLQVNQSENISTEETPNPTHCFALVQKKASSMLCLQMEQKDTRDQKGLREPAARVAPVPQHHLLLVSDTPGAATTLPPAPVPSPSLTSSATSEPGPLGAVKHLQSRLAIALLNAVRSLAH